MDDRTVVPASILAMSLDEILAVSLVDQVGNLISFFQEEGICALTAKGQPAQYVRIEFDALLREIRSQRLRYVMTDDQLTKWGAPLALVFTEAELQEWIYRLAKAQVQHRESHLQ